MSTVETNISLKLTAPGVEVELIFQRPSIQETAVVLGNIIRPLQRAILDNAVPYCPVHGVFMQRHEKDGREWWSHKLANGQWCNGLPGPAKPPRAAQQSTSPGLLETAYGTADQDEVPF